MGRNDAANLINAVFGARILRRRTAILIAGVAAVLGATAASPVIETARKGIFDPLYLATLDGISPEDALRMAMTIYVSVYIVDTVSALRLLRLRHAHQHHSIADLRS